MFGKSVTQRIGDVAQPRGGYLKPKDMIVTKYNCSYKIELSTIDSEIIKEVETYVIGYQ